MGIETKLVDFNGQKCTRIKINHTCSIYEDCLIEQLLNHYRFNVEHSLVDYYKTSRYKYYYFKNDIMSWYEDVRSKYDE